MKTLFITIAAILSFAGVASAGGYCELNRGTILTQSSQYYGQMVVMCGAKVVATRADLEAQGVDIFDAAAVQEAVGGMLPARGGGSVVVTRYDPITMTHYDEVVDEPGHDARW